MGNISVEANSFVKNDYYVKIQKEVVIMTRIFLVYAVALVFSNALSIKAFSESKMSIVGGKYVSDTDLESRSAVGIYYLYGKSVSLLCSGTLIHKKLVATSAYCLNNIDTKKLYIGFGAKVIKNFNNKFISVKTVHLDTHSIAIVELEKLAPEKFIPVELNRDLSQLKIGLDITLAGYGVHRSDDYKSDAKNLSKLEVKVDEIYDSYNMFSYNTQGACRQDEGGPAYVKYNNQLKLMGIIHVSSDLFECRKFGALGSIPHLAPWIDQVSESILGESLPGKSY